MITYVFIYFFLAIALDMIQFQMTKPNYWVKCNGIGTVHDVMAGKALAPMQYRILVPAIYVGLEKLFGSEKFYEAKTKNTMFIYEPLKILFMFLGMWAFHVYLTLYFTSIIAFAGTIFMALFWVTTFKYDYADCYLDVCFWSLFCYGVAMKCHWLVVAVFILAMLNREVSILMAPLYSLLTGNWGAMWLMLLVAGILYVGMYAIFGRKQKYCTTRRIFELNWADIRELFAKPVKEELVSLPVFRGAFMFFVVLAGIVLLALNFESYPQAIRSLWLINIPFMVLVFIGARIVELRVLMPLAVSVIPSLLFTLK